MSLAAAGAPEPTRTPERLGGHPPTVFAVAVPEADRPQSHPPVQGLVVSDGRQAALQLLDDRLKQYTAVTSGSRVYLKVQSKLAKGTWCCVYRVRELYTDEEYALKMVPANVYRHYATHRADIEALMQFQHTNVLKYYDHFGFRFQGTSFICIQLELCNKRTLFQWLQKKRLKKESPLADTIGHIVGQIACGLEYIHQHGKLHGDLCPESVLLTSDRAVKLYRFGLFTTRRRFDIPLSITGGDRRYCPPEWLSQAQQVQPLAPLEVPSPSYDMWSLGCVLSELCTLKFTHERFREGGDGSVLPDSAELRGLLAEVQATHGGAFHQMSRRLLHSDPVERPAATDVMHALRPFALRSSNPWAKVAARWKTLK